MFRLGCGITGLRKPIVSIYIVMVVKKLNYDYKFNNVVDYDHLSLINFSKLSDSSLLTLVKVSESD